ncbi:TIR domain-containing protein [Bradyrhizobium sp. HKCCYLS3077]|uniref:TIR domain-containing protein n=1 Tax=Bradyrhizobium sp. HKCCYLS3077 TaxID=3420761 RepID=UPI003EBF8D16
MSHYALIVDDDGTWRDILSRAVERAGLKQDSASAAPRAIELIDKKEYVLALLDADLGNELGRFGCSEVLAELKARGMEIPAIIVSGLPSLEQVTLSFQRDYKSVHNFSKVGNLLDLEKLIKELAAPFILDHSHEAATNTESSKARKGSKKESRSRVMRRTRAFIGHGHSPSWLVLKNFLVERLGLEVDEFNRVPVAGRSTAERLTEMMESAAIAFLVLSAEDETSDNKILARQNVVHELGLFQGRLGFTRAIVLLEEGCEEFSNIHGIGQIRFPKGKIQAIFEEIRHICEREKVVARQ